MDEFLQRMGELFECVLFTASLAKVSPPPPPQRAPGATRFPFASSLQSGGPLGPLWAWMTRVPLYSMQTQ